MSNYKIITGRVDKYLYAILLNDGKTERVICGEDPMSNPRDSSEGLHIGFYGDEQGRDTYIMIEVESYSSSWSYDSDYINVMFCLDLLTLEYDNIMIEGGWPLEKRTIEADDFVKEYGKNGLENFKRAISLSSGKLNQLTGQLQKAKGILEMLNLGEEK